MNSGTVTATPSEKGVAVVTGASSGIGRIYADRLAKRGYDLILIARRGDRLDMESQRLHEECGVSVETMVADLGDVSDLERMVNAVASDRRITMLVNNAGSAKFVPFPQMSNTDIDAAVNVNTRAVSQLSRAVLPGFKERDKGAIINISSMLSLHFLSINCTYSGTKAYLVSFTRGLQEEVAGSQVMIQLVIPAVVATEIWENGGFPLSALDPSIVMTAEDCVDAALAGFDIGEKITLPSLEDDGIWNEYDAARLKLLAAAQTKKAASRYRLTQ